jgi:methylated-DNA-protein-cysteine methyltransferase related protein
MCKQSNRGVTYDRIYSTVRRIPKGRVATYGQVACLAGIPRQPRQVGYALAALRDDHPVPWHRVVNSKGEISQRSRSGFEELQRILLESEGVIFDAKGRISLSRFRWRPKDAIRYPMEPTR